MSQVHGFSAELHYYSIDMPLSIFQQLVDNDNKLFHHVYDMRY